MNPRERISAALNHKSPDKVPVDCASMRSTGIMAMAYNDLKRHLGIDEGRTLVYDMVQQLALPEDWYLERFQIDSVDLCRAFTGTADDWIAWTLPDGSAAHRPAWVDIRASGDSWSFHNARSLEVGRMGPSMAYFTQTHYPLHDSSEVDLARLPDMIRDTIWANNIDPMWRFAQRSDFPSMIRKQALRLRQDSDRSMMAGVGCSLFETGQFLYRTDEFLIRMLLEGETVEHLLDRLTELHLQKLAVVVEALGDVVDVFQFGDDFGTQSSTMISPELYRSMIKPRQKRLFSYMHDHCPAKVFLHSCGAVADLIGDFIDVGVDILNPVQIGAVGMEPANLKRRFGKDIVFWGGGIDTQHVLANGSVADVRDAVLRSCDIFMPDGGFVFNQVHNIVSGVPPENIVAMYDAVAGFC
jgi:uroporphyrinogen decarboxylase